MCRAATCSPVQTRLAGPTDQKLPCPSTLGVSDSTALRHPRQHQSELVPGQLLSQGLARSGHGGSAPCGLCVWVRGSRLVGCCLVQTQTPQPLLYDRGTFGQAGRAHFLPGLCSTATEGPTGTSQTLPYTTSPSPVMRNALALPWLQAGECTWPSSPCTVQTWHLH